MQTKYIIYIENLIDIQLSQTQELVYVTDHYGVDLKNNISATILYGNPQDSRSRYETGSLRMIQDVPGRGIIGNIQQACSQAARSIGRGTQPPPRYMKPRKRQRIGGKQTKKQKVKKLKKRSKKIKKQKQSTRKRKVK